MRPAVLIHLGPVRVTSVSFRTLDTLVDEEIFLEHILDLHPIARSRCQLVPQRN